MIAPDGSPTPDQLAGAATGECAELAGDLSLAVDGTPVTWRTGETDLSTVPGMGELPTLRLTCALTTGVRLDESAQVSFSDGYLTDRVGWREITADGDGVRLIGAPVPTDSVTDELRNYPVDLLASPLDLRSFTVAVEPGQNTGAGATARSSARPRTWPGWRREPSGSSSPARPPRSSGRTCTRS
jgi:nickel/cobalt exporter